MQMQTSYGRSGVNAPRNAPQNPYGCALSMALISKTTLPLNDGGQIPVFGIGVYLAKANGEAEQSCLWALENGYRMIDTAAIYK